MLMWLTLKLAYLLRDKHTLHNKLSQWCKSNYKSNCKTNLTTYQILRLLAKNYDGVKQKLNPQVNLTLLKKNSLTKKPTKKKNIFSEFNDCTKSFFCEASMILTSNCSWHFNNHLHGYFDFNSTQWGQTGKFIHTPILA